MIFKKQKPYCEVGTITNRLGMRTIYIGERRWEWLRAKERLIFSPSSGLNQHICIIGTSGSGKSNACRTIAKAIARQGIRFAILDPHGEYVYGAHPQSVCYRAYFTVGLLFFEYHNIAFIF